MFGSLRVMRDWLVEAGVSIAAMESTSAYWKPPLYCLEEVMVVWLLNAGHMKAVPGRESDVRDAEWIAQLLEHGLLAPSFVPPPQIRRLRMLTRYRVQLMGDRRRDLVRLELMLELSRSGARWLIAQVRFPRPLAEPAVRLSAQRALHGTCRYMGGSAHGVGMFPR
jgi:transposase